MYENFMACFSEVLRLSFTPPKNTSLLAKIGDRPAHKIRLQAAIFFYRQIVLGLGQ
jgi:hypothetical protein